MGKSTTANMFKHYGCPVFDADQTVHRLYSRGGRAINQIKFFYPEAIVNDSISREKLRDYIVKNPEKLEILEGLIHPLVSEAREDFLIANKDKAVLVFDVPLLFETGLNKTMDINIVVTAPHHVQYERVMSREGMTETTFKEILAKQMTDDKKRTLADIIITTDKSLEDTKNQVFKFLLSIEGI
jgi:dephospho-CoA kinase